MPPLSLSQLAKRELYNSFFFIAMVAITIRRNSSFKWLIMFRKNATII